MGDDEGGGTAQEIYVLDKEFAWVPALLVEQGKDTAKVRIPQYKDEPSIVNDGGKTATGWKDETVKLKNYPNQQMPMANMLNGKLNLQADMCNLPYLHEVRRTKESFQVK
jgi:hypothetical protein